MPDLLELNDFLNGFRDGRRFQIQTSLKRTAQFLDDTSTLRPSRNFVYQTGILLGRHLLGKTGSIEDMRTLEDTVAVLKVSLMMLLVRSESFSGFFDCCKNVFCSRFCLDSWNQQVSPCVKLTWRNYRKNAKHPRESWTRMATPWNPVGIQNLTGQ